MWLRLLALVGACCLLPGLARAHEFWLFPATYRQTRGDTLEVSARVGTGFSGALLPYTATRTRRFQLIGARNFDLTRVAINGDSIYARFIAADGGGSLVAYESRFTPSTLPAAEFERYLRLEGLDQPRGERTRRGLRALPGRERYLRCAKTWIAGSEPERALRPLGLALEIVPRAHPVAGSPLDVQVLFHRKPLAGALVRVWRAPLASGASPQADAWRDSLGSVAQGRTNRNGLATLPRLQAGEYLVNAVHMIPCRETDVADWESYWASLTFAPVAPP